MKLSSIHIKNFKRFKSLLIKNIPKTAKLIILTGPNGSGKSSLFEAFNYWNHLNCGNRQADDKEYLLPNSILNDIPSSYYDMDIWKHIELNFYDCPNYEYKIGAGNKKTFYIRSAYRNEPDFQCKGLNKPKDILDDKNNPAKLIFSESRVSDNYLRIIAKTFDKFYDSSQEHKTFKEGKDEIIGAIQSSVTNVFDDLYFDKPTNPMEDGTFRFNKGMTEGFHYKNLSGGEKAAFDLLVDLIIKKEAFDDTIFCIDEPELHMHTSLQARLLQELFNLTPENCQLWISTHSIGMARKAADLYRKEPNKVVFIDFHNHNFDESIIIEPSVPSKIYWKNMFATALDDLAELIMPENIIFCEGRALNQKGKKPSFDAEIYNIIFSNKYPSTQFIPLGGTSQIETNNKVLSLFINKLTPSVKIWSVIDLDDRSTQEIENYRSQNIQILKKRDIENYLWDDEILYALCEKVNKKEALEEILNEKKQLLLDSQNKGNPLDDIKSINGALYNYCKKKLALTQCGNNVEMFAIHTLAPLFKAEMSIYKELEKIIFDPINK